MGSVLTPDEQPRQALLVRWLNELSDYVILRNEKDLFENLARGGDLDLLVGDPGLAERTLIHHVGQPLRITRRSSVTGYSYEWGHIDLLSRLEWRGACYLQTHTVLEARQRSASGRPVPAFAHEALISWLTSLLWGGFFKERYDSLISDPARVDHSRICEALIEAFGKRWGGQMCRAATEGHPEVSAAWARSLRFALWWRTVARSPGRTIRGFLAFVMSELRLRIRPPVPWIAVVGTDPQETASVTTAILERFAHVQVCSRARIPVADGRHVQIASRLGTANARDGNELGHRVLDALGASPGEGLCRRHRVRAVAAGADAPARPRFRRHVRIGAALRPSTRQDAATCRRHVRREFAGGRRRGPDRELRPSVVSGSNGVRARFFFNWHKAKWHDGVLAWTRV